MHSRTFVSAWLLLACVLLASACARAQQAEEGTGPTLTPPQLSDSFTAYVNWQQVFWNANGNVTQWLGAWVQDMPSQKRLLVMNESDYNVFNLAIFDEEIQYSYLQQGNVCSTTKLTDKLDTVFAWLHLASYVGQDVVMGNSVAHWQYNQPGKLNLNLYVTDKQQPVRLVNEDAVSCKCTYIVDWFMYDGTRPHPSTFNVPPYCPAQPGLEEHKPKVQQDLERTRRMGSSLSTFGVE